MTDQGSPQPRALPSEPAQNPATRTIRKRARRACIACRARKVRCDLDRQGAPCTNCKLDAAECVVKPRARKWARDLPQAEAQLLPSPEPVVISAQTPSDLLPSSEPNINDTSAEVDDVPAYIACQDFLEDLNEGPNLDQPAPCPFPTILDETHFNNGPSISSSAPSQRFPATVGDASILSGHPFIEVDYLWRLPAADLAFLKQRGSFQLPPRPALDEFVERYFLHIHPILPILNESDFWNMYLAPDDLSPARRRIPLFVFQAMLFIACPFVPLSTLRMLGFLSVRDGRSELYSRAKALFDTECYGGHVTGAQGALMLTYHVPTSNDKTNTYWLITAIHLAESARADEYDMMDDGCENKNMLKRLWWCCILRDRIMALGLRRPLHIRSTDFDRTQPGLDQGDFDSEIRGSKVYDPARKQVLVQLAVSLCDLAVILSGILPIVFPTRRRATKTINGLVNQEILEAYATRLDLWYWTAVGKFQTPEHIFGVDGSITLFTNMIYIYYHTAKASLCSHIIFTSVTAPSIRDSQADDRLLVQAELARCLRGITDGLTELAQLGLVRYLPNTFVAFSAFAFAWHILDAQGAGRDLGIYKDVMCLFRNLYESTDEVLSSIGQLVDHIRLNETMNLTGGLEGEGGLVIKERQTKTLGKDTWADLLAMKPRLYLRIVLMVDFSLSMGRLPAEADFPEQLRIT